MSVPFFGAYDRVMAHVNGPQRVDMHRTAVSLHIGK